MRAEQIMSRPVHFCRPDSSLADAAQMMQKYDCGCLPVSEDGKSLKGIITDRDICMRALAMEQPLKDLPVSDAMSREVRVCGVNDDLADVEEIMRNEQIRRLPVVSEDNVLAGMISLADLAQEAEKELLGDHREITVTEIGDTLAAICKPTGHELAA